VAANCNVSSVKMQTAHDPVDATGIYGINEKSINNSQNIHGSGWVEGVFPSSADPITPSKAHIQNAIIHNCYYQYNNNINDQLRKLKSYTLRLYTIM